MHCWRPADVAPGGALGGRHRAKHNHRAMTTYNRQQWIESFEGQLSILRPHLGPRVIDTVSNAAWSRLGVNGEDPIKAAKEWSEALDAARETPTPKK